jgi:hypothetical protein
MLYGATKNKHTEKWFNDNAKNLERIPGAPPAIKDARKHLVKDYEKIKKGEVPFPFREEYILNESDYSLIGWRPLEEIKEAKGPVPLHRKILDDSHRNAWYRLGRDWPQDIVEEVLQEGGDYSDLTQKYFEQPKLPKVVLDKNLTWIDKEIDRLKNIWENEDALSDMTKFRFASFPEQITHPFGTLKDVPDTDALPNWYDRIRKLREEVSPSEVGDITKAEDAITELQTTPDPVTKGSAALSDNIVEKITEVQTTPDPLTRTIDEKISKLQEETKYQDEQAQKAKTTGDVKDKFLSRRQLLFPRNKNTGGLVGLY